MLSESILEKYRFARENCGCIVGENAKSALNIAREVDQAESLGLEVSWDFDQHFSIGDQGDYISDEEFRTGLNSGRFAVLCGFVEDYSGQTLVSLGGVIVDYRSDSWRDYLKSFEYELLSEALSEIKND
jgi:hypothetical protein